MPHKTDWPVWVDVMQKNYHAAHDFTMAFLPAMLERRWGRVVTVASLHGREAGGRPWFTAAKAAEVALMATMARFPTYARAGVTFNSVAPGPIVGAGWAKQTREDPDGTFAYIEALPMGRLGKEREVADVVLFLCSTRASWVNGACIAVDGGQGRAF